MISIAGGEDVAGDPGPEVARGRLGRALRASTPTSSIAMPCGWYVEDAHAQAMSTGSGSTRSAPQRVFAVDAASTFSEPGPRLVDGVELLGHLLHPDLVDPPGNIGFAELRAPQVRRAPSG